MTSSERKVTGWIVVVMIYSVFHICVGLLNLWLGDIDAPPVYWFFFLIGVISGAAALFALDEHYSAARVLMWIGGILSFPLGLILIRAATRIKQAAPPIPVGKGRLSSRA